MGEAPSVHDPRRGLCLCKCKCDLYSRITLNKETLSAAATAAETVVFVCIFIDKMGVKTTGRESKQTKLTVCFLVLVCDSHKTIYTLFLRVYTTYILLGKNREEIRKRNKQTIYCCKRVQTTKQNENLRFLLFSEEQRNKTRGNYFC